MNEFQSRFQKFVVKHHDSIHFPGLRQPMRGKTIHKFDETAPIGDNKPLEVFSTIIEKNLWKRGELSEAMMKALPADLAAKIDQFDEVLEVYGYASTAAVDKAGDIVTLDALRAAVEPWMEWGNIRLMHNGEEPPVGKAFQATVDSKGLFIGCLVAGKEVIEQVMLGSLAGFSIGFWPEEWHIEEVPLAEPIEIMSGVFMTTEHIYVFDKIELVEISLVDRPCNPEAKISRWEYHKKGEIPMDEAELKALLEGFTQEILKKAADKKKAAPAPTTNPKAETSLEAIAKQLGEIKDALTATKTEVDATVDGVKKDAEAEIADVKKFVEDLTSTVTESLTAIKEKLSGLNVALEGQLETPAASSQIDEKSVSTEDQDVTFIYNGKSYSIKKLIEEDKTGLAYKLYPSKFKALFDIAKEMFDDLKKGGAVQ